MAKTQFVGVGSVARKVKNQYIGVGGVARKVKAGYAGVNNVARQYFMGGTPLSALAVGSTVQIKENGTPVDYLVVHQGLPGSLYDASCDGCWLLRKDCLMCPTSGGYNPQGDPNFAMSGIKHWMNATMLNNYYSENMKNAIKQVKIPYRDGGSNGTTWTGSDGLPCKLFLLSMEEVGYHDELWIPVDGAKLDYFYEGDFSSTACDRRMASMYGSRVSWYSRSPIVAYSTYIDVIGKTGVQSREACDSEHYLRNAMILPSELTLEELSTM